MKNRIEPFFLFLTFSSSTLSHWLWKPPIAPQQLWKASLASHELWKAPKPCHGGISLTLENFPCIRGFLDDFGKLLLHRRGIGKLPLHWRSFGKTVLVTSSHQINFEKLPLHCRILEWLWKAPLALHVLWKVGFRTITARRGFESAQDWFFNLFDTGFFNLVSYGGGRIPPAPLICLWVIPQ